MSVEQATRGTDIENMKEVSPQRLLSLSLLLAACVQIALGIGAMAMPVAGALAIEIILGVAVLAAGLAELFFAWEFRAVTGAVWRFLRAACFIAAGVVLLAVPFSGIVTLTLLLGFGFVFDGALRLIHASQLDTNRTWAFLDAVLGLLLGFIIVMGWPADSVFILGTIVGIRLLMAGGMLLIVGGALRRTLLQG